MADTIASGGKVASTPIASSPAQRRHARPERLRRYALRPPVTSGRLTLAATVAVLRVRHPRADGTTHLGFEPTGGLERLAVLAP